MRTSYLSFVVPGLLALAVGGCSGGGDAAGLIIERCSGGESFCVVRCDLGCTQLGGCALTEIAENQSLRWIFSQKIDPSSVNGSSLSIRNGAGQPPEGDLLVSANEIRFQPRITTAGGISRFGFQRNETYIVTLAGGPSASQGIRSISGDRLAREFTCTASVTLGIIDLDQAPPRAELVIPSQLTAVAKDTAIVIRFSELIDTGPFLGTSTLSIPIRYNLKRTRQVGGVFECDASVAPVPLEGNVRVSVEMNGEIPVSVISMSPNVLLPGLACVEVLVSGDVRDLAGVAAVPATFRFVTEAGVTRDLDIVEEFTSATKLDAQVSSGSWGAAGGGARPGLIGGDGRHGPFDVSLGTPVGSNIFEINTDSTTIPGTQTLSGQPETVTDGQFFFTDLNIPEGTTIRFTGSNPPQFLVRGTADIGGSVELNAPAMGSFTVKNTFNNDPSNIVPGQPGGAAATGGGRGGRGGDRSTGVGLRTIGGVIMENGVPGEDLRLPAGHAYRPNAANTAGRGAPHYPTGGLNSAVTYTVSFAFNGQLSAGGGGGGFVLPGSPGHVSVLPPGGQPSADIPGGVQFNLFPIPPGASSLIHFLVGGSGGGGGGSHPFLAITGQLNDVWRAGAGGSGGGGAMAVRAGSDFTVRNTSRLEARGGSGFTFSDRNSGIPTPGGGGSGGSFLLQGGVDLAVSGVINASGGAGSRCDNIQPSSSLHSISAGGAGSTGFYRLEAAGTVTMSGAGSIPTFNPAQNAGTLTDRDDVVGSASTFYGTGQLFPPDWLRYVLQVDLDGNGTVDATFSDDPAFAPQPANSPTGPVRILFRGARLSTTTGLPLPGTQGLWRPFLHDQAGSNLNQDGVTGARFLLLFNRRDFPNAVVKRLVMTYRA